MADFETSVWNPKETWVWAWCYCEIGNEDNIHVGNNIDDFMQACYDLKNSIFYFQNEKFDGEFIIYWLLTHGFKHVEKKEDIADNTFTTLISDMGVFYQICVYFKKGNKKVHKVTFIDSLKIIPLAVREIPKAFGLEESKLEIDYKMERPKGWILTKEEIEYIKHDVIIVSKALNTLFNENLTKMTQGSNALSDFKDIINKYRFMHYFPELDYMVDKDMRPSYKGGFTYVNPIWKEKEVGRGCVLDVNSLYPSVMYNELLPFGDPIYFEGQYKKDVVYDLYIQRISCSFKIKENKIPCIQIKKSRIFTDNEYITDTHGEIVTMTLTNVDLELFLKQYDITSDLIYQGGWKFKSIQGLFCHYIDKWMTRKIEAGKQKNQGQRTLAKLMLNSLYGKFATTLDSQSKLPYLREDGIVGYELSEKGTKKGLYLPVGCFITAYARRKTIETSQAIQDYSIEKYGKSLYYYSDTDSIHCGLTIDELKQFCDIDDFRLGAWKHENTFKKAKFIRQKCYIEKIYKKRKYKSKDIKLSQFLHKKCKKRKNIIGFNDFYNNEITCAGMPQTCYDYVTWENFKVGLTVAGKLTFKHVKGGVILVDTDFTIKEETFKKVIENFDN